MFVWIMQISVKTQRFSFSKYKWKHLFFCSRWRSGSRTAGPRSAKSTRRSSSSRPPPRPRQRLPPTAAEEEEAASTETAAAASQWWQAAVAATGWCLLPPCLWTSKRSTEEKSYWTLTSGRWTENSPQRTENFLHHILLSFCRPLKAKAR